MSVGADLPPQARLLADRWGFVAEEELPGGHCSKVFANATQVLKVPFAGEELTHGVSAALKLAHAGGPAVLNHDRATGAVLMERLVLGTELDDSSLSELERQAVFVRLAQGIALLDRTDAIPLPEYVGFQHPLLDLLEATTVDRVFLHGDLHHANILADGNDWRPIDPKGLYGDRHYECVAFLRNPMDELQEVDDLLAYTEARVLSLAAQLELNPWRIVAWGLLDRMESEQGPSDDPWTRLLGVYAELERRLRQSSIP